MGSLTSRGRALVVVAFVLSAALCGGAAVALVAASRDDAASPSALPTVNPTLVAPSPSVTPTPSASPTPTPTPSPRATVTATPSPTAAATSSPAPRRTSTARPAPTGTVTIVDGLEASAALTVVDAEQGKYVVTVHATDGSGTIYLKSVDWGDQTPSGLNQRGTACSPAATAPADCRNYSVPHTYADPSKDRIVTVTVVSGTENAVIHLTIDVTQ